LETAGAGLALNLTRKGDEARRLGWDSLRMCSVLELGGRNGMVPFLGNGMVPTPCSVRKRTRNGMVSSLCLVLEWDENGMEWNENGIILNSINYS
jgi:hypothetical protein